MKIYILLFSHTYSSIYLGTGTYYYFFGYTAASTKHSNAYSEYHVEEILDSISVNVSIHIPDVPGITYLKSISTTSASNESHPPTDQHICRPLLTQSESKNIFSLK